MWSEISCGRREHDIVRVALAIWPLWRRLRLRKPGLAAYPLIRPLHSTTTSQDITE